MTILKYKLLTLVLLLALPILALVTLPSMASAADTCGDGPTKTQISFPIGCQHKGNAFADMFFAIIRFLGGGVGLVLIGSTVVGGIQYSASRGDPNATAKAVKRLRSTVTALLMFVFGYALLGFIIPAGFLR